MISVCRELILASLQAHSQSRHRAAESVADIMLTAAASIKTVVREMVEAYQTQMEEKKQRGAGEAKDKSSL